MGPAVGSLWGQRSGLGPGAGCGEEGLSCPPELGLSPPGFSSPCTFVAALSGANGSVLWERPAAQDGALVQCSVPQLQARRTSSACVLVGRPGSFVAVDLFTGRQFPMGGVPHREALRGFSLCSQDQRTRWGRRFRGWGTTS